MNQQHQCGLRCVEIKNMTVLRGRDALISNVSLNINCGQITAVIGANGAGKTTLLRAVLGDVKSSGTIAFSDHHNNEVSNLRVGYVPQQLNFDKSMPVSVLDFLIAAKSHHPVFVGHNHKDREHAINILTQAGCADLYRRRLGQLSGGELQRVMLALALDPAPDLLLLDEPVSGVDRNGLDRFYQTLSDLRTQNHMAILLVSHDLNLVMEYADHVVLLGTKVLSQGTPQEVYASEKFKNVFGTFGGENL